MSFSYCLWQNLRKVQTPPGSSEVMVALIEKARKFLPLLWFPVFLSFPSGVSLFFTATRIVSLSLTVILENAWFRRVFMGIRPMKKIVSSESKKIKVLTPSSGKEKPQKVIKTTLATAKPFELKKASQ